MFPTNKLIAIDKSNIDLLDAPNVPVVLAEVAMDAIIGNEESYAYLECRSDYIDQKTSNDTIDTWFLSLPNSMLGAVCIDEQTEWTSAYCIDDLRELWANHDHEPERWTNYDSRARVDTAQDELDRQWMLDCEMLKEQYDEAHPQE